MVVRTHRGQLNTNCTMPPSSHVLLRGGPSVCGTHKTVSDVATKHINNCPAEYCLDVKRTPHAGWASSSNAEWWHRFVWVLPYSLLGSRQKRCMLLQRKKVVKKRKPIAALRRNKAIRTSCSVGSCYGYSPFYHWCLAQLSVGSHN
jgi:hypothetical protein